MADDTDAHPRGGPGAGLQDEQPDDSDARAEDQSEPQSSGATGSSSGPRLAGPVQLLRRSTTDRKLAGVCGGLGAYTNIDPLVYRVLFAVFSLFGGFGVLLYGAAWLIIPEHGQDESEGQRLARGRGTSTAAAWAIGTTVLGFVLFVAIVNDRWNVAVWIIVIAAITYFIVRSRGEPPGGPVGSWWSDAPPAARPPGASATPAESAATGARSATADVPPPPPAPPAPPSPPSRQTPRAPERRRRSFTGWIAMSTALVVSGVLVGLDAGDVVSVPTVVVLATALVILGVGLIVGTWYGRARALIFPGFALILALAAVTALGSTLRGPIGDVDVEPVSVAEIEGPYRVSIGKITIDLRRLDLNGSIAFIEGSVGLGQIEVIYPNDIRVEADTDVEVGSVDTFGASRVRKVGGYIESEPSESRSGTVRLDLDVGIGSIGFTELSRVPS